MSSTVRFVLCAAAFALACSFAPFEKLDARVVTELAQFGGAVLVGDGEVFAGESNNQFRPGIVYVYRKTGANWAEAAQIVAPKSAVGDGFGASLSMSGSTLFVGAGAAAVHVFTKQGAVWTFTSTIDAATVP